MAKNLKLADVVKKFSGEGDVDVVSWLDRFERVADLQGVGELAQVISLFLDSPAYDVYAQLPKPVQENESELKRRLKAAFGLSET